MNSNDPIKFHQELVGKIKVHSKVKLTPENLPLAYTPGVGEVSLAIAKDKRRVRDLTGKFNKVAIVTDGSAVLGLGNIGPEAALPVMEGKAAIFADFAGVNAFPVCLSNQDPEIIIETVKNIAPAFGGINLEDIAAPQCFEIERRLSEELDIPVFHDDQHGTAIVVLAGLLNALKVVKKDRNLKIVISGAGAAGLAIADLLAEAGFENFCLCDSQGAVTHNRTDLNKYKKTAISKTKALCEVGKCQTNIPFADVFIGVSKPGQLSAKEVSQMNEGAIVFALANPDPEILPVEAKKGGAVVVATGRSDFPNQINNALVFPGLFRGLLDNKVTKVTPAIKVAVAEAIASLVRKPNAKNIIPSIFDPLLVPTIVEAVKKSAKESI
jgi:malate dehydrogenase (oxaloacetate-decarboxylating)